MLQLPRGITGFWSQQSAAPPRVKSAAFRARCATAAVALHGKLLENPADLEQFGRNFYVQAMTYKGRTISILCNVHAPWLALIDGLVDASRNTGEQAFVDDQLLSNPLANGEWRVLDAATLRTPLNHIDLTALDPAELTQVAYWKPRTVGEIVFNHWD